MMQTYFEDLAVGQSAERVDRVSEAVVKAFAELSGDHNPVHLDREYAATTIFKGQVAHGVLLGAYVSALASSELPGPGAILRSVKFEFVRPVRFDTDVKTRVEIERLDEGFVLLACTTRVGFKLVMRGEALVIVPKRPVAST